MESLLFKIIIKQVNKSNFRKSFDFTYQTQKYRLDDMLPIILTVIKTGISWKKASLLKCCMCNPSTVYRVFKKLCQKHIIKNTYLGLIKQYLKKTPAKKLKCKIVDSSVIPNKYGYSKTNFISF